MRITDLDEAVENSRKMIHRLGKLDLPNRYDSLSIDYILTEIKEEADKITEPPINGSPVKRAIVSAQPLTDKSYIVFLKSIEKKLRRIAIYEERIRPAIKNKYHKSIVGKKVINGRILLEYHDSEFIDGLYRNILGREADYEGKKNNLFLLRTRACSKMDMLDAFINSKEGQKRGIIFSGVGLARLKNKVRRSLLRIPIIGYCLRWIVNVFLLPRKILALPHKLVELSMISPMVKELERKVTQLESRIAVYDEEKNLLIRRENQYNKRLNEIYLAYQQDLMNNTRIEVKNRLIAYVNRFEEWVGGREKKDLAILDLGCGTGEWLELLMENGYMPRGIDSNDLVIANALEENSSLNIITGDALTYLENLPANSLDMITSLHLIEHLDLSGLFTLLDECKRVLKTGGLLMLSTPNPQNILIATYLFRMDPTHKNPIPVELLQFYLKKWDFNIFDTVFAHPLDFVPYEYDTEDRLKHVVYRFNLEQEYSILAVKK